MKRWDIKRQLKREAESETPEIYDSIANAARAEGLLPYATADDTVTVGRGNSAAVAVKKRGLIAGAAVAVAAVICLSVTIPLLKRGNSGLPLGNGVLSDANDVYGMGAVSTVRLLGSETAGRAMQTFSAVRAATGTDVKAQAEKFNEYFTALDGFFGDDVVTTVSEKNTDANYDYENKLTVNGKNFDGETVTHVMYYTETLKAALYGEDKDDDLDDDYDDKDDDLDDDRDEDKDGNETERVYTLVGVMIVDGKDYYMQGERSVESEDDETENELKIRAYADKNDRLNYVEMEQEYSEEAGETETEYVYGIYVNGKCVEQTAVEFEKENKNGKEEVEYELEFRSGEGKGKYKIERENKDGDTAIKVKYNLNGESGQFRITQTADKQYRYVFEDGTEIIL